MGSLVTRALTLGVPGPFPQVLPMAEHFFSNSPEARHLTQRRPSQRQPHPMLLDGDRSPAFLPQVRAAMKGPLSSRIPSGTGGDMQPGPLRLFLFLHASQGPDTPRNPYTALVSWCVPQSPPGRHSLVSSDSSFWCTNWGYEHSYPRVCCKQRCEGVCVCVRCAQPSPWNTVSVQ